MMELTIVRNYSRTGRRSNYVALCTHGERNDSDYSIDGISFVDAQVVWMPCVPQSSRLVRIVSQRLRTLKSGFIQASIVNWLLAGSMSLLPTVTKLFSAPLKLKACPTSPVVNVVPPALPPPLASAMSSKFQSPGHQLTRPEGG